MSDVENETPVPEEIEVPAEAECCADVEAEAGGTDEVIELDEAAFVARVAAALGLEELRSGLHEVAAAVASLRLVTVSNEAPADDPEPTPEPPATAALVDAVEDEDADEEEPEELLMAAAAAPAPEAPVATPTVPLATKGDVERLEKRMADVEERVNEILALVIPMTVSEMPLS